MRVGLPNSPLFSLPSCRPVMRKNSDKLISTQTKVRLESWFEKQESIWIRKVEDSLNNHHQATLFPWSWLWREIHDKNLQNDHSEIGFQANFATVACSCYFMLLLDLPKSHLAIHDIVELVHHWTTQEPWVMVVGSAGRHCGIPAKHMSCEEKKVQKHREPLRVWKECSGGFELQSTTFSAWPIKMPPLKIMWQRFVTRVMEQ